MTTKNITAVCQGEEIHLTIPTENDGGRTRVRLDADTAESMGKRLVELADTARRNARCPDCGEYLGMDYHGVTGWCAHQPL